MKKIFLDIRNYILLVGFIFSLVSCDSLLEESPTSFISPEKFYNTEADAFTAIAGIYGTLSGYNLFSRDLEMMTAHGDPAVSSNRRLEYAASRYAETANFGDIANIWKHFYIMIGDANKAAAKIKKGNLEQDKKDQYYGEALFLRAIAYYYLTALFGDVPLWVDELTNNSDEIASLSRTDVTKVREQIIKDLTEAYNLLPDSYDGDFDKVRATKWAAKSLMAKTYLYMKKWTDAADAAKDVMDNSNHILLDDYSDIFTMYNEYNDEIIFTLDYKEELNGTGRGLRWGVRSGNESAANREDWMTGYAHYVLRQSFINTYDTSDDRLRAIIFDKNLKGNQLNFVYLGKNQRTEDRLHKEGINFILLRLADIILVHAEATNEAGDQQAALKSLNMVRHRAKIADRTSSDQNELREMIRLERRQELIGENQSKIDLMRWGTLVEEVKALPEKSAAAGEHSNLQTVAALQAEGISSKNLLFPIPEAEFSKNPSLGSQNPGW